MASSVKLTAVLAVVAVCFAVAATPTALGYPVERCETQDRYFTNCLRRGFGERCCGLSEPRCLCLLKQELEIQCVPKRSCPSSGVAKAVKLAEMKLKCMQNLKCKRA